MKISVFNKQAPLLINKFEELLNKLVAGNTNGLDFDKLKNQVAAASETNALVTKQLTNINREKLVALRANAAQGEAYGKAVDHNASLSNLLPVLTNLLNEMVPEEDTSIDDLLGDNADDSEDDSADGQDDGVKTKPVTSKNGESEEDKEPEDDEEEGDDSDEEESDEELENMLKNFKSSPAKKVVTKSKNSQSNSGFSVPTDFLK